jgi:flagellar biosynthesis protein FliR
MILVVWSTLAVLIIGLLNHIAPQIDTFSQAIMVAILYGFIFVLGIACTYLIVANAIQTFKK